MRTKTPPFSLTRQLIRPSWNKYNLFNLSRKSTPSIHNKTMYQQKWEAKKETRAYHGDHLVERQFKNLWDRRLVGVAGDYAKDNRKIPLASQTYASLEKRLDIAIFRALFASSTKQAKQMVVHGKVSVNGREVSQPGHILKAGDLFEIDPAAVIMNVASYAHNDISGSHNEDTAQQTGKSDTFDEDEGVHGSEEQRKAASTIPNSKLKSRRASWITMGQQHFTPKPYMSAFAFIPSYLEVSFETCSAVYLRDPVARPGFTEVPSPHVAGVHALAANFYQRGR
ncbi:37S ribosomal protein NAM9 [Taphrina deformans PYCC 5710]|uniref:37S ribosomal protein NAM9 n=1 Tax=Taphrina deformans (strain PYCC 5710 / ATCC 11124 / CBS 356.35 / IMI 108563 / JCM 9778 / NBRC 8474) TaxID=1097556 RepID=R4X981_TAPDE|nr:37S ribosomal protein NAM9 [Taphrina deformans PYCC 5710]|eukprot:CCG81980.1 37S ribosomal protein NAM9 [Taphrina deformans PYCC 5710]